VGAQDPLPSVSVIVPCLNEAGNIVPLLDRLPQIGPWMEIIFIDGGSTDGTLDIIHDQIGKSTPQRRIRFIQQEGSRGKGGAVRQGFEAADGDILMILDSDISVAPEDLPKFYGALVHGKGELPTAPGLFIRWRKRPCDF